MISDEHYYAYFIRDNKGELLLDPDDGFTEYAVDVATWIGRPELEERHCSEGAKERACRERFLRKMKMFGVAWDCYAVCGDPDNLRHEPHVIENYDTVTGYVERVFIFKEDNNGTTYRVFVNRK